MTGILANSSIKEVSNEKYLLRIKDFVSLHYNNEWSNIVIHDDNWTYVNVHATELKNIQFNSMLMFGLGLGLTPYLYQNKCSKIDVIEIDEHIIDIHNQIKILNDNVTLYLGDALNFNLVDKYDLIFVDIFGFTNKEYFVLQSSIIENYKKNLNVNGKIYFPDSKTIYCENQNI
jgi:hypothetical protein